MARKRKADMTHHQTTTAQNDAFRAELLDQHLEDTARRTLTNDDNDTFRKESYKQALKDAKATKS